MGPRIDVVDVLLGLGQAQAKARSSKLHSVDRVACSHELLEVAVDAPARALAERRANRPAT